MNFFNTIRKYRQRTIARDLTIWLILSVCLGVLVLGTIYYFNFTRISQANLEDRATRITDELVSALSFHLWDLRYDMVRQISKAYLHSDYLVGIRVEVEQGQVIFDTQPVENERLITTEKTILHGNFTIGKVTLTFSTKKFEETRRIIIYSIILTGFFVIAIILVMTHFIIGYLLNKPLEQLIQRIRIIAEGDYKTLLQAVPQFGINQIINEVNEMAGRISERTDQLEQEIIHRKNIQAEAFRNARLASLGELAAGVAHEINNPINGIINYAQILIDRNPNNKEDREISECIIKESDRIEMIVSNLLSFARKQKEEMQLVSIHKILGDSLNLTHSQLGHDSIKISVNVSPDLPLINANTQQIQQVFLNIISNARDALNQKFPDTDENKKLIIEAQTIEHLQDKHVQISFYDTGIGIPENIRDKLFDPFFTTKPPGQGTGLGLSISHGILKNHKAGFHLDSVEGEYANVLITFSTKKEQDSNE